MLALYLSGQSPLLLLDCIMLHTYIPMNDCDAVNSPRTTATVQQQQQHCSN